MTTTVIEETSKVIEKPLKIKSPSGTELQFVSDFSNQLSFVIGSHGLFSSGKTRLPVTGPDLTFILPEDQKSRRTIENVMRLTGKKFGKNILIPPEGFIEQINPMQAARLDEETSKKFYRDRVERIKEWLLTAHAMKDVRLIAIDTCTNLYQDMCYATYGREGYKTKKLDDKKMFKDKSDANQELMDLIRSLATKPLLLLHKSKDEYVKGKDKPIGLTFEGYRWIGNQCEVGIMHEFNRDFDEEDIEKNWRFGLSIISCQDRVELQGPDGKRILRDDEISMPNLMRLVFPDTDWSDWDQ